MITDCNSSIFLTSTNLRDDYVKKQRSPGFYNYSFFHFVALPKEKHLAFSPYRSVIIDLNFADDYSCSYDEFFKPLLQKLFGYQGWIIVLNNKSPDRLLRQFLFTLFSFDSKRDQLVPAESMFMTNIGFFSLCKFAFLPPLRSVNILHEIQKSDQIVGFHKENKCLIPFRYIDYDFIDYLDGFLISRLEKSSVIRKLEKDPKKIFETHFSKPFFPNKDIEFLCNRINNLDRERDESLQRLQDNSISIKNEMSILFSKGEELEKSLIAFLKNKKINVSSPENKEGMDFYFEFTDQKGNKKYVICEVKGMDDKNLTEMLFRQLRAWEDDFKNKFNKDPEGKNTFLLGIVNNSTKLHPEDRNLSIADNLQKKYENPSFAKPIKIITTVNLRKIINSQDGKKFFYEQIIKGSKMQILFDDLLKTRTSV